MLAVSLRDLGGWFLVRRPDASYPLDRTLDLRVIERQVDAFQHADLTEDDVTAQVGRSS